MPSGSDGVLSPAATEFARAVIDLVRSNEKLRLRLAAAETLTSTEFRALARISEVGQKTPKRLAQSLDITSGTVTAVTDRLVERALLERVAHPEDRRSILLQLTPAGRELMDRVYRNYYAAILRAVSPLTEEGIAEVSAPLARLSALLDEL
jgi:DNA-binding MarR family transcriptional regulator